MKQCSELADSTYIKGGEGDARDGADPAVLAQGHTTLQTPGQANLPRHNTQNTRNAS